MRAKQLKEQSVQCDEPAQVAPKEEHEYRADSIDYLEAIKALREHLNGAKLQQQSKNIVSVINETVKSLEATLILNNFNNKCANQRFETSSKNTSSTTSTHIAQSGKPEKSKYTLTRVIKKVTFHPNKSNPDTDNKRVELLYIWGADNRKY